MAPCLAREDRASHRRLSYCCRIDVRNWRCPHQRLRSRAYTPAALGADARRKLAAALFAIPRMSVRFAARDSTTVRRAQHRAIIVGAGDLGQ